MPLIAFVAALGSTGCAGFEQQATPMRVTAAEYDAVFVETVEFLRDEGFSVALRDRRGGLIATEGRAAGSAFEPWWWGQSDFGGTWLANRYPGCGCDVASHLYSFSFAPNADWSNYFSPAREICDYMRRTADALGLRRHASFNTELVSARWLPRRPTSVRSVSSPSRVATCRSWPADRAATSPRWPVSCSVGARPSANGH